METIDIDAYAPAEMAARVEEAGITKGNLDFWSTFALSLLAGGFIAFGAVLYTFVVHDSTLSLGMTKLLGGLVFCLGLILVVVAGAELFTGNNLIVMAYVSRKVTMRQLLKNWATVFAGNFIGSIAIVILVGLSGIWAANEWTVGAKALAIANGKVNLGFMEALIRGILCNTLVCLAVWLCFSGRSVTDKILAIIFPITAFVALGLEHSVANMYFIPAGLILAHVPYAIAAAPGLADLSNLTLHGFFVRNLLPVTIGNIIGGSFVVGAIYWFVYLRRTAARPVQRLMTTSLVTVPASTTVADAIRMMREKGHGSILVGDGDLATGIVSEADVVRKVVAAGNDPARVRVEEIMSAPVISAEITTPIHAIYRKMADSRIRHLVITDKGKQVGFVSVKDLIKSG